MNFGQALEALKLGKACCRTGWNGKGMWIGICQPADCAVAMTLSFLYMKTADDQLVPWLASQTDILADDWQIRIA